MCRQIATYDTMRYTYVRSEADKMAGLMLWMSRLVNQKKEEVMGEGIS